MFAHTDQLVVAFRIGPARERFGAYCRVLFPGVENPPTFDCILDTGTSRIVVPQRYWRPHVPQSTPLKECPIRGVGGSLGAYEAEYEVAIIGVNDPMVRRTPPYSLGRCTICLARDEEAVEAAVVSQRIDRDTARNRYQLRRCLLGLGGGAFDKGGVCINWQGRNAHFVEVCPLPCGPHP
jgi:hypothetical protein